MKNDLEHISILIKKYFEGLLSQAEASEFDTLLLNNPEAKMLFEDEIAMRSILIEADLIDVKNQMKSDLNKPNYLKYWTASLITIAIITTSTWLFINSQENNTKDFVPATIVEPTDTQVKITEDQDVDTELASENKQPASIKTSKQEEIKQDLGIESDIEFIRNNDDTIANKKELETEIYLVEDKNEAFEEPFDCSTFKPNIKAVATPSSFDMSDGSISITQAQDNLMFRINADNEYSTNKYFTNIATGTYNIWVKNEFECEEIALKIDVPETFCVEVDDDKFYVDYNTEWEIPYIKGIGCKIHIYDKTYKAVFSKLQCTTEKVFWDGMDLDGNRVSVGLYKIVIEYKNGKTCISNVTVIE